MSAEKIIQAALAEVGYLEKATNSNLYSKTGNAGRNNYTKYAYEIDTYHPEFYNGGKNGYPWCDVFVDWLFIKAYGEAKAREVLFQPKRSAGAGCEYSVQYYKAAGRYGSTPKVWAQIFFKGSDGYPCHTGLVYKMDSAYVYTVEGNTSGASGVVDNGGGVCCKSYPIGYSLIHGYGYPNYPEEYTPGWNKNAAGWWYVHQDGSYTKDGWEKIDEKWYYFDKEGYMMENKWVLDGGDLYYMGADGAMVTNRAVKIGADGKAAPAGAHYHKLSEVPQMYRPELDKLIAEGKLKGREGAGEDLVLDMSEEMVRALVILSR